MLVSQKTLYYLAAFLGGSIGGYIPVLWGDSYFSIASLVLSGVGAIVAIILVWKFFNS